jgi:hypothetical protein
MLRKSGLTGSLFLLVASATLAAGTATAQTKLSAAEIAAKNIEARGGLQAWHEVQTLSFTGKLGAGGDKRGSMPAPLPDKQPGPAPAPQRLDEEAQLPFVMEMERPRKVRFELQFKGQTALQVYDGTNGWKLRPYLNRLDVEPYSTEELKAAATQPDIDGPLVDYAAKGTRIELAGEEKVEGRDTYNLKLTMKSGQSMHLWIDAETFLEAKIEGRPRQLDGRIHPVEIYYRDYRSVDRLKIPFVLETKVLPLQDNIKHFKDPAVPVERVVIDRVIVNPKLEASLFTKPAGGETASRR